MPRRSLRGLPFSLGGNAKIANRRSPKPRGVAASTGARDEQRTARSDRTRVAHELHDEAELACAQNRIYRAHDPGTPDDLYPLTNLERLLAAHAAGRDDLVTAT